MSNKKRILKQEDRKTAMDRIKNLFSQAEVMFSSDPALSDRYVSLARKLAMKHRIRIPRDLKRRFCKHCFRYLVPSKNCRVRINNGKVVYHCSGCKGFMRFSIPSKGDIKKIKKD